MYIYIYILYMYVYIYYIYGHPPQDLPISNLCNGIWYIYIYLQLILRDSSKHPPTAVALDQLRGPEGRLEIWGWIQKLF